MTDHLGPLSEVALGELTRRRQRAQAMVRTGTLDRAEAETLIRRWAGIAAWFGAVLPPDLRAGGAVPWIDFIADGQTIEAWRRELAEELRRAAQVALERQDADRDNRDLTARARGLLALDRRLSIAADLGPFPVTPRAELAAA